jgi:hypothetical protein
MRNYVIDYYPAVVTTCEDAIHILVSYATHILKCCARFSVALYTPNNILDREEKQLTVDHVCRILKRTDRLFGTKPTNGSILLRCT